VKNALICLLALQVAAVPCFADVIPTRYDDADRAQQKAVQARLQDLGASPQAAEHRARQMSQDELAFFSADSARIQSAGALYWYEWLIGAAFLGILTVIYFEITND
jgi:hypothetical protein